MEGFRQFLEMAFVGPVWPASVLMLLLLAYALFVLVGLADSSLGLPDMGMGEPDLDVSDTLGSFAAMPFRLLNLDSVPVFLWGSIFGLSWWILSLGFWAWFDSARYEPTVFTSVLLSTRNLVIAVGWTGVITKPMRGWFERGRAFSIETLVDEVCEIQTGEANVEFGRAKYKTDGAPLLLNVRTRGETLVKGERAKIVDYDPEKRIYIVESVEASE